MKNAYDRCQVMAIAHLVQKKQSSKRITKNTTEIHRIIKN